MTDRYAHLGNGSGPVRDLTAVWDRLRPIGEAVEARVDEAHPRVDDTNRKGELTVGSASLALARCLATPVVSARENVFPCSARRAPEGSG